jgi:ferredoxin
MKAEFIEDNEVSEEEIDLAVGSCPTKAIHKED